MEKRMSLILALILLWVLLTLPYPPLEAQTYPEITQLTKNDLDDHYGGWGGPRALSWDGSKVGFFREHSARDSRVYVMNTTDDPGEEKLMTMAPGRNDFGSITADGGKIVFGSNRKNPSDPWYSYEIFVMSTTDDLGEEVRITDDALLDHNPDISGNGEIIAWHSAPTSWTGFDIKAANISDMSNVQVLTLPTGPENDEYPSLTSDGAFLSFWKDVGSYDNYGDIAVINTDGSGLRSLTNSGDFYYTIAMSADGKKVACRRKVGGDFEIFICDVADKTLTQLTDNDVDDFLGGINGDGTIVVYSRDGQIFMHDMTKETQLSHGFYDEYPRISGDGSVVIFSSNNRDGPDYDIFMMRLQGLSASVDIKPDSLNLDSKGEWIAAHIELPEGYYVASIDVASILLNGTVPIDVDAPVEFTDYDGDGIPELMVKFDRAEVIQLILDAGVTEQFTTVTLTLTGSLNDGTQFQGSDNIKAILKTPKGKAISI